MKPKLTKNDLWDILSIIRTHNTCDLESVNKKTSEMYDRLEVKLSRILEGY